MIATITADEGDELHRIAQMPHRPADTNGSASLREQTDGDVKRPTGGDDWKVRPGATAELPTATIGVPRSGSFPSFRHMRSGAKTMSTAELHHYVPRIPAFTVLAAAGR